MRQKSVHKSQLAQRLLACLLCVLEQMAAAAAAGRAFVPPPTTYEKSQHEGLERAVKDIAAKRLSAEDACKWRKLNTLYGAEGWAAAAAADAWDSEQISPNI